jgi:hypothetical protein
MVSNVLLRSLTYIHWLLLTDLQFTSMSVAEPSISLHETCPSLRHPHALPTIRQFPLGRRHCIIFMG